MPRLANLLSVVLNPPSNLVPESAAEAPGPTPPDYFQGIPSGTLHVLTPANYGPFREWVATVPFSLPDTEQEQVCSLRTFFELGVVTPCWPGVLAMADPSPSRGYDLALMTGSSTATSATAFHPDICVMRVLDDGDEANPHTELESLTGVEFLAVDALTSICDPSYGSDYSLGGGGLLAGHVLDSSPAWRVLTSRLRKYAVLGDFRHLIVADDRWAIYFGFSDPATTESSVRYAVTSTGGASGTRTRAAGGLTLREMFLLSVWAACAEYGLIRYSIPPSC